MEFSGRAPELGRLRGWLDARKSTVVRLTGIRGGGKSALLERVLPDYDGLLCRCPPLPDPTIRRELARQLAVAAEARTGEDRSSAPPDKHSMGGVNTNVNTLQSTHRAADASAGAPRGSGDADWGTLLDAAAELAEPGGRPFVLILDDAHRLAEARSRLERGLGTALARAAARSRVVHVVLAGSSATPDVGESEAYERREMRLGPLPFRAAAPHLPGRRPAERLRSYGVFGGMPGVLAALDPGVTLGTNVRRLVLDPAGPLADAVGHWLEPEVQTPARYVAVLAALSGGEADWAGIHEGVPDLTTSGQVAPYLKKLGDLGLVTTHRSLDAAPRSRSTRYRPADPFLAFWHRFVLPYRFGGAGPRPSDYYTSVVRPHLDDHLAGVFPVVCRQHMIYDATETLGTLAREGGSLWSSDVDLPVAGILANGAVYYGRCAWRLPERSDEPLREIDVQIRETRYGFGRENRLRLIFTGDTAPTWLRREAARRHDAEIIDATGLAGDLDG